MQPGAWKGSKHKVVYWERIKACCISWDIIANLTFTSVLDSNITHFKQTNKNLPLM